MKMLPVQLSLNPQLSLWNDMLWRCPPAPPSQLAELKTQLPASLPSDPRLWSREDVNLFLRFCEREFDLPKVDYDLFQMNGKALCLLTRADFDHRCPGAGDVLHNVLQMLIIESHMMQWHLPNSPVTPTSRYPLSPHSHPPTPTWPPIAAPPDSPFHNAPTLPLHHGHFMAPNSVTLSPPPSVDSQASSPPQNQQPDHHQQQHQHQQQQHQDQSRQTHLTSALYASNGTLSVIPNGNGESNLNNTVANSGSSNSSSCGSLNLSQQNGSIATGNNLVLKPAPLSSSSNNSDSDEETFSERASKQVAANNAAAAAAAMAARNNAVAAVAAAAAAAQYGAASPPTTPILKEMKDISQSLKQQITSNFVNSWAQQQQQQSPGLHNMTLPSGASTLTGASPPTSGSVSAPTTPSFMQPVKREFFPETTEPNTNGRLLWDFLQQLLNDRNQKYSDLIAWKCRDTGVFKIVDPAGLAKLWGIQKNHLSMNYDKMSRALRYYYRVNILRKVQGERHCYQFLRNPSELKNIKNISLLRQTATSSPSNGNTTNGASNGNSNSNANANNNNSAIATSTNSVNGTNWPNALSHQSLSASSFQQPGLSASSGQNGPGGGGGGAANAARLSMPPISTATLAAAAAAAGYAGGPPTSPLFMHAFHYLSNANSGPPPNSPATLPPTPSEKFQFSALKSENGDAGSLDYNEDMKPTDLSVNGSERRPFSNPPANIDDGYTLIRNADGLTTIKLIRYSNPDESRDGGGAGAAKIARDCHSARNCKSEQQTQHSDEESLIINGNHEANNTTNENDRVTPMATDSDSSHSNSGNSIASTELTIREISRGVKEQHEQQHYDSLMPTDLRK